MRHVCVEQAGLPLFVQAKSAPFSLEKPPTENGFATTTMPNSWHILV